MPLITNLGTLDYADGGSVFMVWATPALAPTHTLNFAHEGFPFYAQFATQALSPCVVTITARDVEVTVVRRRFPNRRQEMVGETQIKRINPIVGAQYVQYLP